MNAISMAESLKRDGVARLYLFEGEEEYVKQAAFRRLLDAAVPADMRDFNYTALVNPEPDALIAACETLPFLSERRMVVVRDCDALSTASRKKDDGGAADKLCEYAARVPETTCLVFYQKGKADARKKLTTALTKTGVVVASPRLTDGECASWARRSAKAAGKAFAPDTAAQSFVFTVGRDAAVLASEMEKLVAFTGGAVEITQADIDAVCTRSLEYNVFQMVDAQVAGQMPRAFQMLSEMLRNGEERVGILAMLLRQYRLMYHARRLRDERVSAAGMARMLEVPPFAAERLARQCAPFPVETLARAYTLCFDTEFKVKSGALPQEGVVERTMLRLNDLLRACG